MTGTVTQALYSGLVLGAMYATMAMGLTLVWTSMRLLNLAHGAVMAVGSFAAYSVVVSLGAPVWLGPVAGLIVGGVLGGLLHLSVYQPLMKKEGWETNTLAAGLGAAIAIEAGLILVFGGREKALPSLFPGTFVLPGGVRGSYEGALIIISSTLVLLMLASFLLRSRYGIAIRAQASNIDGARLVGIDTRILMLVVMIIGGALGGLAGVLLAAWQFVSPLAGFNALLKALMVTILGGLGNLRGTVAAAFIVGLLEATVATGFGVRWSLPALFMFIAIVLVVRPEGLGGKMTFGVAQ